MPVVGLTALYDKDYDSLWMLNEYMALLDEVGLSYLIVPFIQDRDRLEEILSRLDGIVFTGGQDVSPDLYGEKDRHCLSRAPRRDHCESLMMRLCYEKDIPTLAICRGFQLMNAVLGGTLYQDLEKEYVPLKEDHNMDKPYQRLGHGLTVVDPVFAEMMGTDKPKINSLHHQGLHRVADSLTVCALSPDGLVEAVRAADRRFFVGVQWHPEYAYPLSPENRVLFEHFKKAL